MNQKYNGDKYGSLKLTAKAPENGFRLKTIASFWEFAYFQGASAVGFRAGTRKLHENHLPAHTQKGTSSTYAAGQLSAGMPSLVCVDLKKKIFVGGNSLKIELPCTFFG